MLQTPSRQLEHSASRKISKQKTDKNSHQQKLKCRIIPASFSTVYSRLFVADIMPLLISRTSEKLKFEAIGEKAVKSSPCKLFFCHQINSHVQNVANLCLQEVFVSGSAAFYIPKHGDRATSSSHTIVTRNVRTSTRITNNCVAIHRNTAKIDVKRIFYTCRSTGNSNMFLSVNLVTTISYLVDSSSNIRVTCSSFHPLHWQEEKAVTSAVGHQFTLCS